MKIEADLTPADIRAFQRHILFRYRKVHWIFGTMMLFFSWITWNGGKDQPLGVRIGSVVGLNVLFAVTMVAYFLVMKVVNKFTGGHFRGTTGKHTFEINEYGAIEINEQGKTEFNLSGIRAVDETKSHFLIISKAGTTMVIPKRAVTNSDEIHHLQDLVRGQTH